MSKIAEDIFIEMDIIFRVDPSGRPSPEMQINELWHFARILQHHGLDMGQWYVSGDPRIPAFSESGPTAVAIKFASDQEPGESYQTVSIWNGLEGRQAAGFSSKYRSDGRSTFEFISIGINSLYFYNIFADIVEKAIKIWPALIVEVTPYKYKTEEKVFKDRPGAGWMLYLSRRIEIGQVPEARVLRHIKDLNGAEGTLIISEIDGPFDADNPEHVSVANDIEIRLADQDLLPRYKDL